MTVPMTLALEAGPQMCAASRPPRTVADVEPSPSPARDGDVDGFVSRAYTGDAERLPALDAYLRRVEQIPRLEPEEQAELVATYQRSRQAARDLEEGRLEGRAASRARREVRRGDAALEQVVASNFRLVLTIAKELAVERFGAQKGLSLLDDLMAEGNLALTEAAQSYDPDKDPRRVPSFPTYAARSIRDRVRASLARHGSQVRIPPSWSRVRRIAHMRIPQLESELGRPPSREEIKAALLERCYDWALERLTDEQRRLSEQQQRELAEAKLRKQGMLGAIDNLDEVLQAPQRLASLDAPVGDDTTATLADFQSDTYEDPGREVELEELREALQVAMSHLTDRERTILLLRYGMVDDEPWTYERISDQFGVTAERIRQIERAVLDRMSSPLAQFAHLQSHLPHLEDDRDQDSAVGMLRRRSGR